MIKKPVKRPVFYHLPRLLKQPAATDLVFGEVYGLLSKRDAFEAILLEVRMPFFDIGSSFSFCSRKQNRFTKNFFMI